MPTRSSTPTRERILDAADQLMRTIGLARTTTKEIARAAQCSEAALYKHFSTKEEIFVHVLRERLPRLNPLLDELSSDRGERSLEENLTEIAQLAARFYERSFPIAASLYAEPALLRRHEAAMRELGTGPHMPLRALSGYLRAEREAGRIRADADPDAAAALLLGACNQRAVLLSIAPGSEGSGADGEVPQALGEFARGVVRTLLAGLA